RHRVGRRPEPSEMGRDRLPRAEGELRLQRLDDLLGPGAVLAAGPHAAVVPLVAAPRARRARAADHPQPAPPRASPSMIGLGIMALPHGIRPTRTPFHARRYAEPAAEARPLAPGVRGH